MEPDVSRVTSLDQDMIVLEIFAQKIGYELENILKSVDLYKKSITHLDDYNREKDFLENTMFSNGIRIVKCSFKNGIIVIFLLKLFLF